MSNLTKEELQELIINNPSKFNEIKEDYPDVDLSESDFSGLNLDGIDFTDADLVGATYSIEVEGKNREYIIRFNRKPCDEIRSMMKSVRIWWDPRQMYWHGPVNSYTQELISDLFDY